MSRLITGDGSGYFADSSGGDHKSVVCFIAEKWSPTGTVPAYWLARCSCGWESSHYALPPAFGRDEVHTVAQTQERSRMSQECRALATADMRAHAAVPDAGTSIVDSYLTDNKLDAILKEWGGK